MSGAGRLLSDWTTPSRRVSRSRLLVPDSVVRRFILASSFCQPGAGYAPESPSLLFFDDSACSEIHTPPLLASSPIRTYEAHPYPPPCAHRLADNPPGPYTPPTPPQAALLSHNKAPVHPPTHFSSLLSYPSSTSSPNVFSTTSSPRYVHHILLYLI